VNDAPRPDDAELRARLDDLQWHVTQEAGTERAFTGIYWDNHEAGLYRCVVCAAPLFESTDKYDSGTGWPSFTDPVVAEAVELRQDTSHGMVRTEVVCSGCGGHLGHVFDDGPGESGQRWCINSRALDFDARS